MNNKVFVTQPFLPPLEDFIPFLKKIWSNKILTNNGPFHQQLEHALCDYLNLDNVVLVSNGTLALILAVKALKLSGEVITTPYSFVATSHALLWNNLKPVFVDIDPTTLNLDPLKICDAISSNTAAILPVHCYGNPCDTAKIQEIANYYNLPIIYDACHAFGVEDEGGSILRHGNLSVLSFHATKVFNTFEGGAIICPDIETKDYINQIKNFGFKDEITVTSPGINAKMCEINAAFGILQLQYIDNSIKSRSEIDSNYRKNLKDIIGIRCIPQIAFKKNYSYFPILLEPDYPISRDQLYQKLQDNGIYTRRYFYPLIPDFPIYKSSSLTNLSIARSSAENVLCLPIYQGLSYEKQMKIIEILKHPLCI